MTFQTALSGLNAASIDLAVTGNNIANASTNGFKQSRAEFADVYATNLLGISATTPGSGVRVANVAQQFNQGNVDFTDNNLDLAINGQGFFVLSDNGAIEYTRAGTFHVDRDGFAVNGHGQRLQVFPPVVVGSSTIFNTGTLNDLQLSTTAAPPNATSQVGINVNLNASETPPIPAFNPNDASSFNHSTSLAFYDSLGAQHTSTLYFAATAVANEWDAHLYVDGSNVLAGGNPSITLAFGTDGSLSTADGNASGVATYDPFAIAGANPLTLAIDYFDSTQFGGSFGVNNLSQDGFSSGRLNGVDISPAGVVQARFSNGQSNQLGQVALGKFPNEQGLSALGDTNWGETFESGNVNYGAAGTSDFGSMQSGALEASNVDISEQLVNLILAQRNFQANAQVITTQDTVTQTIINI